MTTALATAPTLAPEPTPILHVLPDPPAKPAAKKPGLNLGAIAKAKPEKGGKTYPIAVLDDEQRGLVTDLLAQKSQATALEGSIKALTDEVNTAALTQWLALAQGQTTPPSSIILPGLTTDTAIVTICGDSGGRFKSNDAAVAAGEVAAILGDDAFAETCETKTVLKIDLDEVGEDIRQALVDDILAAFTKHGATHAISATENLVFKPAVKVGRFTRFTPEQNQRLAAALPLVLTLKRRS